MIAKLWTSLLVAILCQSTACAEGLLFQLPEDGAWVSYDIDAKAINPDGTDVALIGTLTVSSVGKVKSGGEMCRWIEIVTDAKRAGEPFVDVDKLLIPERHLGKGKDPLAHVIKWWTQHSMHDGMPKEVPLKPAPSEGHIQKLRPLLHAPYQVSRGLDPATVDGKLGDLRCKGVSAKETSDAMGASFESTFTIRTHEKVPFGVVSWELDLRVSRNGQPLGRSQMKLKAAATGLNRKSKLPDQQ